MEVKKCSLCGNEFNSKMSPGVMQKYCSKQCRMKAGNNRRFETIKSNLINEIKGNSKHENENEIKRITSEGSNVMGGNRFDIEPRTDIGSSYSFRLLELNFEAKTKIVELELKNFYLEKEIQELKTEYHNLEMESEDIGEEKGAYEDILGGVMDEFKKDPITTLNFASGIIGNLFGQKTKVN